MKLRKRKQEQSVPVEDLLPYLQTKAVSETHTSGTRSDARAMNVEIREALEQAIMKVPGEYRAVFILRDIDGLSNKEVGEILDLSIPAVKSRLHRSRLMLRKKLRRYYNDYTSDQRVFAPGARKTKGLRKLL